MSRSKRTVRLLRLAEEDLADIVTFITADNPSAAASLARKMERALERLAVHPYIGIVPADEELVQLGYRYLILDNYLVFYTVEHRTVLIHRIIHGARDYRSLL